MGISWAYLGHIFSNAQWAYLVRSLAYHRSVLGISSTYLGHIFGISQAYFWHISGISQHMLDKVGCQDGLSRLVVRIAVISSPSASSVSIFGIFPSIRQPDT